MRKTVFSKPHDGVWTRLAPSRIHGIGVFAVRAIQKGTNIFEHDNTEMVWIAESELKQLPKAILKLYEDFGVFKDGRYGCPRNFNQLTPAWYVNCDPDNPNLYCDENHDFIAARNIKEGEKLTIDYSTYSEE